MGRPKKIVVNEGQCVSQLERRIDELETKNRNLCHVIEQWETRYNDLRQSYDVVLDECMDLKETLVWVTVEYIKYKRMYEEAKRDV